MEHDLTQKESANVVDLERGFLSGGGELGHQMREHDWAPSPLGEPQTWPRSLKTVVRIMLTSSQPIWIGWGEQLLYLYNDPYKSIIGGKHPWALGRPTAEVWREIWDDIEPLLASAMSGDGTFVENQLLIMERNGYPEETYYTFSYSPIPDDSGRPAGIICANSDETRRVIGERQLALLREMSVQSSDSRTVADAVTRCLDAMSTDPWDITFAEIFLRRRPHDEWRAMSRVPDDVVAPSAIDPADACWEIDSTLQSGSVRELALPADHAWPQGAWNVPPSRAMVLPLTLSGEDGLLIIGLNPYRLRDSTYRDFLELVAQQVSSALSNAHAYESARLRAEELAELDRAKTAFFSNVSHEFRTPLTLMLGPLEDMLASPELPPSMKEPAALVDGNARRLSKLVNMLLEFSRLEAGRHASRFQSLDLAALTADVASTFESAMERAGLSFSIDCRELPAPVYVDADQWERILLNLLSNALKFTLTGGVTVRVRADRHTALLEVQDTGIGIPPDEIGRLFDRFHRVQGSRGRTFEGSGIGLALVKELVRAHGGAVDVESTVDIGTLFRVRLPFGKAHLDPASVQDAAEPRAARGYQADQYLQEVQRWLPGDEPQLDSNPASASVALLGERYRSTFGARVLLADDNADMRRYLGRLLSPHFEVQTASDGLEALQIARQQPPALLVSDVMMPRLDGFGLLTELRADPNLCSLPVILLSARAGEEARVEGLQAGADDYLVKPFSSRELLVRIAAAIALDRARRAGEEQLRLSLAGASMFAWDIDVATRRVVLSDNAAQILGGRPEDLAQSQSYVHPEDNARHRQVVEQALRTGGGFTDEIRIVRANDGDIRWLEVRGRLVTDASDAPVRLSGLSFDITRRKTMEEELRHQDRLKDEFLAMLAHELRNPMAPIRNAVEVIQLLQPTDQRMKRAVRILDRQVLQLSRMVDDLLDVSRITRGRIELERKTLDLSAVISSALEAAEPMIRQRQHAVSVHSGLPITVVGDAARLQQCVVNLLANSAKYTDPGGRIEVTLQADGGQAIVRVADNGVGIPADLLPEVFDLFVQSDRTLDRSQGGLGIGLSVVRRLVEMHDGTVCATSAGPGHGATFEIRLPLAPATASTDAPVTHEPVVPCKVLVVDDNQDAAESLCMMLEAEGHEVRMALSAVEALQVVSDWRPDLVLLDIGMPEVDGYELARRLRAQPALAHCCLVALTGYGQPSDQRRARDAGFDHHLVKPAPMEEVARIVREGVSRARDAPASSAAAVKAQHA